MKKGPVTPKGFRDIDPDLAKRRREMINSIADVLEGYGFVPLETPTLEFAETLLGKYGEDEKLIYQFDDRGGRKLALRYDLTVPLARYVANNLGILNPTFSRYQIGQIFRGENPQKGRRREFTQFDFDTVGSSETKEDARIIMAAINSARAIGLKDAVMQINDRAIFDKLGFSRQQITTIDKIEKIGKEAVEKEVGSLKKLETAGKTERLDKIFEGLKAKGFVEEKDFTFNPFLARGLNYYTSTIFELKLDKTPGGLSIGGGGRYDNLIGMFVYPADGGTERKIPAVGFSFGIDRILTLI